MKLDQIIAVLDRTPGVLDAWLGGLDESWTHRRYADNGFSPYEVVAHLIAGERTDWIPRTRIILEHGESRPFDPFPHDAALDPESGPPLRDLLAEFASLRTANLDTLRGFDLTPDDLAKRGAHPGLGAVTLSELLHAWVTHDLHHIAQIAKGMAYQSGSGVGPFRDYLGIVKQAGD